MVIKSNIKKFLLGASFALSASLTCVGFALTGSQVSEVSADGGALDVQSDYVPSLYHSVWEMPSSVDVSSFPSRVGDSVTCFFEIDGDHYTSFVKDIDDNNNYVLNGFNKEDNEYLAIYVNGSYDWDNHFIYFDSDVVSYPTGSNYNRDSFISWFLENCNLVQNGLPTNSTGGNGTWLKGDGVYTLPLYDLVSIPWLDSDDLLYVTSTQLQSFSYTLDFSPTYRIYTPYRLDFSISSEGAFSLVGVYFQISDRSLTQYLSSYPFLNRLPFAIWRSTTGIAWTGTGLYRYNGSSNTPLGSLMDRSTSLSTFNLSSPVFFVSASSTFEFNMRLLGQHFDAYIKGLQMGIDSFYKYGEHNILNGNPYGNGYAAGEAAGKKTGYNEGLNAVSTGSGTIVGLFGGVASVPISILNGLSSFTIWNVPIINVLVTFLFIGLIAFVIRKFVV